MIRLIIFVITILIFAILQICLSTRNNKFIGLIIPAILFAIMTVILLFVVDTGAGMAATISGIYSPVIFNLVIYFICRVIYKIKNEDKTEKEINKMTISDL